MIAGLGDIGRRNAEVARAFLQREQIPCVSESLGGNRGRRVQFWPASGRARQMLLADAREVQERPVALVTAGHDLELF
jgi:chemotaxis protein CheD